jgi:hypothetical protein
MFLTALMFFVAIALSAVAAFYSIVGLTAIFAAAVMPIIIMGTILEIAKVVTTIWLHEYWRRCSLVMKLYLVPAVIALMVITSMGIFGFLSKAHLDQTVPTGDVAAQVSLIDERINNERDTIANARSLLAQLDRAVVDISNTPDREVNGRVISSAERALQVRRQQARDRAALTATIEQSQARIIALQEEKAPFARDLRKIEAEVGPVKYIAALIYGDNPDDNLLERAVRWVIILLVAVFDPMAIMMLLAATESHRWVKSRDTDSPLEKTNEPDIPARDDTPLDHDAAAADHRPGQQFPTSQQPLQDPRAALRPLVEPDSPLIQESSPAKVEPLADPALVIDPDWATQLTPINLEDTIETGFGEGFPENPGKGDLFVYTGSAPTSLFKFNGRDWIVIDKSSTDSYTHDEAYIDYLISSISSGRYDPDLLSDAERSEIEKRLRQEI